MSRVVITDRFKNLRDEIMNPPRSSLNLHDIKRSSTEAKTLRNGFQLSIETSKDLDSSRNKPMFHQLLPEMKPEYQRFANNKYFSDRLKKTMEISLDTGTKRMTFPNMAEAESWSIKVKNNLFSPTSLRYSTNRDIESSINGLAGIDDIITKKYSKLLLEENKLDKLCELHTKHLSEQQEAQMKVAEKYKEELRMKRLDIPKAEMESLFEKNKEILDILDRKTRFGFRKQLRMMDVQKKKYTGLWNKYSDYKL